MCILAFFPFLLMSMTSCQVSDLQMAEDGLTCQPTLEEFTWPALGLPKSEEEMHSVYISISHWFLRPWRYEFSRESLAYFCLQIPLPLECMHVTSPYGGIHFQSSVLCAAPHLIDSYKSELQNCLKVWKRIWVCPS